MVRPPPLGVGRCSGASPKGEEGGRELHGNGWNGWNGLAPPSPHVLLPGKLGGQANAAGEGKSSMRQPLCAATIIGPTARQVSPCRKAPNLSQAPAAAPDWTRCIHRPGYIIRILPASSEQFCGAGIGRELEWASTSRLQSRVNSSRGRRRLTARQAKMIQLKVCSAPTESQASS